MSIDLRCEFPYLSVAQCQRLDALMVDVFKVSIPQLMELAGYHVASFVRNWAGDDVSGTAVSVVCGTGNNGGDGLVAARYLHAWGAEVGVFLVKDTLQGIPLDQLLAIEALDISLGTVEQDGAEIRNGDIVVDAVFGFGLNGEPRDRSAMAIDYINESRCPVLSVDIPSGMHGDEGSVYSPQVVPTFTLTMACPKKGFRGYSEDLGRLYVADIGVPLELYETLGVKERPVFSEPILFLA